ncbi:MAG TPA: YmdB family metallophosphoesterase, partial [Candidatus Acidoferrales bacterium]|nr:YmdB family metallophosphoesterase [Candidatus Acidoferrales bacterium]
MRILFLGDVVGSAGCRAVRNVLPRLIDRDFIDLVVVNCENVTRGAGVDPRSAMDLLEAGAHVLTSGNHIWRRREILDFLPTESRLLRPANYPQETPGRGWTVAETADGTKVAVVNL